MSSHSFRGALPLDTSPPPQEAVVVFIPPSGTTRRRPASVDACVGRRLIGHPQIPTRTEKSRSLTKVPRPTPKGCARDG